MTLPQVRYEQMVRACVPRRVRNWLRDPRKSFRYAADRLRYRCGAIATVKVRDDWVLRCHPASREHFAVFRTDPTQAIELDQFVDHCAPAMRLLDVGAHYGLFTLAAVRFGGPDARVLCVEASAGATSVLEANLSINAVTSRAKVLNVAMGGTDGTLLMLRTGPFAADYAIVPGERRPDATPIPQYTMESILDRCRFDPTHVKIDIEGFEAEVLESSVSVLRLLKPILFLELHGSLLSRRGKDPRAVLGSLRAAGYRRLLVGRRQVSEAELAECGFNARLLALP
jgi:FkbM family methyltransferase